MPQIAMRMVVSRLVQPRHPHTFTSNLDMQRLTTRRFAQSSVACSARRTFTMKSFVTKLKHLDQEV